MEFPAIAHMISWTVLIYLNLICSFATNRTVASSSASDSILKGCPQSVLDDPTGDVKHCGCLKTNEDSNVGLAALKDGDLTIRTISFACSEAQYLTFGPDSTTAERRSDRPAPLGSASALYQEASCLTGNPMDPSICASGIGRIGFVERCGGDEGGSRLSKDQCVHAFKEAIGRDW